MHIIGLDALLFTFNPEKIAQVEAEFNGTYYSGFIDGCMSVEGNTRDICELATDAGEEAVEGPADEVNTGGELQHSRYYEGLDWRGICNNPLLGSYISQPCNVLVTPDGNALTSEGKVQLESILCPRGPSILSTLEMFYGTISDNLKSKLGAACGW